MDNPEVPLTTLKGNQVLVSDWYINGYGRFALRAATPSLGIVTVEEADPGVFRTVPGKPAFKVDPASLTDLRAQAQAAADEARKAREEAARLQAAAAAEEEARLGVFLQWGSGRSNGWTKLNGVELSERFLEAQLKARGIAIDTDWDRYFTHNARVPKPVCDEIVAAVLTQPKPEPKRPTLTVQLWEPCEKCGAEPSYLTPSGHLCERCAGA